MRRYDRSVTWFIGAVVLLVTPAVGLAAEADTPTFTKDVAPILFENCVSCHRPGEVAPMSLLTYQTRARSFLARCRPGTPIPLPASRSRTIDG